jgi:hypothetical protein
MHVSSLAIFDGAGWRDTRRPASLLIKEAAGSDLLVISAGQSTVFGSPTLGAITLACLTRSPVPVVIVPGQAVPGASSWG